MSKSNKIKTIPKLNICSIFFLFLTIPFLTFGQTPKVNQQYFIWQQRVSTLTDGIVRDTSSLSESERAFYLALLAKISWKANPIEAKTFLQKSAKYAIDGIETNDTVKYAINIKNFQKTLQIITVLDEQLGQKLFDEFLKVVGDKPKIDEQIADILVSAALQTVEKSPQKAFEIGVRS